MATFAERLAERKAQGQPSIEQPPGVTPPQGQFGARLAQRKAEQEQRAAGREQVVQQNPSLGGRIAEAFTGAKRQTPETKALPEFRQTEEIQGKFITPQLGFSGGLRAPTRGAATQAKLTAGLLSSFSPEAQMDVIKESIPEAQFSQDAKGNVIIDIDGAQSILNKPGLSGQDIVPLITNILANIGPSKLAGLAKSTFARVIGGAVAAGGVEQARQEVSGIAGSEQPREPGTTALAGAIGGAAELVGPAREALRTKAAARRIGAEAAELAPAAENIAAARVAEEATGIPLFPAQRAAIPSQLEKQSFIAQLPAGTQKSFKALQSQNEAATDAVGDFLQQIAPPESIVTGAEKFRTAAERSIVAKKIIRKEASSPIYKQAFRRQRKGQLGLINTDQLQTKITKMAEQFDPAGQISINLNKALNKISNAKGDLQKLHLSKIEIDQIINSFGTDSVGNTTKRFLVDVKTDLTDELVKQSPSYRAARSEFIRTSPEVTALEESIIGKVAAFDDTSLKRISRTIFDPAETNPQVVANAKKIINEADPEAWNQLLRVELERRLGSISTDVAEGGIGAIENVPRLLEKALFGNAKQQAILFNAVDGEVAKNLKFLQTALKRAKLGRPGGSQTAIREEIKRELRGGVTQRIRNFFRAPLNTIAETGEDVAFNRRVRAMAEIMFDPKHQKQMAQIRKLNPNTAAAGKAMAQLLKNIDLNNEREQ